MLKFPEDGKEKLYLDKCECKCNNTTVLVNLLPHPEERNCLMLESLKNYVIFTKRPLGVPSPVFVAVSSCAVSTDTTCD